MNAKSISKMFGVAVTVLALSTFTAIAPASAQKIGGPGKSGGKVHVHQPPTGGGGPGKSGGKVHAHHYPTNGGPGKSGGKIHVHQQPPNSGGGIGPGKSGGKVHTRRPN